LGHEIAAPPPEMKIIWSDAARSDLAGIHKYVEVDDASAAQRVALEIMDAVTLLAETPGIGRPGRKPGTRELVLVPLPYVVPYRVTAGTLEVLRVLHTQRRWPPR
jgi:toxin ParE1/3/4